MILSDFNTVICWWLVILFLGFLFLPLVFSLFNTFWDKGWIFSKILGIIVISYFVFLFGRLHLIPFFRETILLAIVLVATGDIWWSSSRKSAGIKEVIKKYWKRFLFEEFLFLFALLFWSFIRGFQPDIEGLEKFMDFGFVNSLLRSTWFPPADMWFAGSSINYYYFGHLQTAVLTKLSGLDPAVTYNLMIATIFAFTFTGTFSLTSNLIFLVQKSKIKNQNDKLKFKIILFGGLVSALLISLGGNLHTITYVLKNGGDKYWYPDATRFIGYTPNNPNDKTIHEFPVYSFVVADLHGHMNDIPTVLLFVATLLVWGSEIQNSKLKIKNYSLKFKILGVLGFLLAVMYMTNSWDFPIYGILFGLFTLLMTAQQYNKIITRNLFSAIKRTMICGVVVLVISILIALPFALTFNPMTDGIALVRAHSLWWQLLVLWGFFWFVTLSFWIFVLKQLTAKPSDHLTVFDLLVFTVTAWATVLIIIPEVVYVKDIYISEYHRANTMFKLVYQSFMMYSIVAGYIFFRVKERLRVKSLLLVTGYSLLVLIGFSAQVIYPCFAIKDYYGSLTLANYKGLYGMNFLKRNYPDNYQAVLWLNKNIKGQPVILEAVGDSYTMYNHVSSMTGLPTIEGWLVHEWLWRGGYDQPGTRASEVEAIYQGEDVNYAKTLVEKYNVKYVLVGLLEREKYQQLEEERFSGWGKIIFSSGETKIYELN